MKIHSKGLGLALGAALVLMGAAVRPAVAEEGKKEEQKITVTGHISDSMCGLDHSEMMKKHGGEATYDETACVQACVKGGAKYVLADPDGGKTYAIKDQKKVEKFAGKRVLVEGELKTDGSIDIKTISLAPSVKS